MIDPFTNILLMYFLNITNIRIDKVEDSEYINEGIPCLSG